MTTLSADQASERYWSMYQDWLRYCDANPMGERDRYTTDELITMSRMDFYYNYSFVRGMREKGCTSQYLYWDCLESMVRARTSLAHWLKEARACSS